MSGGYFEGHYYTDIRPLRRAEWRGRDAAANEHVCPPCPHQWQPIETSKEWEEVNSGSRDFAYEKRKDGQWFRMPLPPLPEVTK